jgi:hypothetical protein
VSAHTTTSLLPVPTRYKAAPRPEPCARPRHAAAPTEPRRRSHSPVLAHSTGDLRTAPPATVDACAEASHHLVARTQARPAVDAPPVLHSARVAARRRALPSTDLARL